LKYLCHEIRLLRPICNATCNHLLSIFVLHSHCVLLRAICDYSDKLVEKWMMAQEVKGNCYMKAACES
jgi:hypothetical protein